MPLLSVFRRRTGYLLVAAALSATHIAGCATTANPESKKVDYGATVVPPLEVPPDLVRPANNESLAPVQAAKAKEPGLLPNVQGVRQENAGAQRWLVVDQPPEKIWPVLQSFLTQMNLSILSERPELGIIETDWAENRAHVSADAVNRAIAKALPGLFSSGFKDRYRVRLEPGAQAGTSEIYLTHLGVALEEVPHPIDEVSKTVWRPRPSDPDLEAEMLRLLMLRLGVPAPQAETILATPGPVHARLVKEGETNRLLLDDEPQRAWRRVGLALDRLNVVVENRDRPQAAYVVRYNEAVKEEAGFFGRMFDKVDTRASGGEFLVSVVPAGGGSEVRVAPREGAQPAVAQQILTWLHEQLK